MGIATVTAGGGTAARRRCFTGFGDCESPAKITEARAPPLVFSSASVLLRSASWILPSLEASVRISPCSGLTSSVTTGTFSGCPLASAWIFFPADST